MQLDTRAQTLLKALVERYIADGQPVGSRALSKISGLELSPATIRNIMADLEEMGFVASPHTSAGRVPTPRRESIFQQIEFLRLSEKRILLVIVSPNGDVQNRLLLTDVDYSPAKLVQAANYINQHYGGLSLDDVRLRLQGELRKLRDDMTWLMQAAVEAGSDAMTDNSDEVVISGERNLLSVTDLS